ncbi:MAG: sigma-E factor regulatory protein RseB domain-containing protein, partial [Bacteroidota bacterium]
MINAMFRLHFVLFLAVLLNTSAVFAQKSPNQILNGISQKMNKVKDYSADAKIRSDIPAIRILPVSAKVYFKQKDKFKVDSKGIVLLPKQGFSDFQKVIRDTNSYTAVITGQEKIGQTMTQVLNVIPSQDTSDLILAKLWIDAANSLVLKSQLTTRSSGTMLIEYTYGTQQQYGLPDNMVFTVDVKKFKIPKGVATDLNRPSQGGRSPASKDGSAGPASAKATAGKKAQIFISLTNYKV